MKRENYLEIKNYNDLHIFLIHVIHQAEASAEAYIYKKGYNNHLLEKKVTTARIVKDTANYGLSFTFFEDAEEIHFKENEVSLTFSITFLPGNQFTIEGSIESVYELKEYTKYYNINELSNEAKTQFSQLAFDFEIILKRFFEKALNTSGNPDELHTRLQNEEEQSQLS